MIFKVDIIVYVVIFFWRSRVYSL